MKKAILLLLVVVFARVGVVKPKAHITQPNETPVVQTITPTEPVQEPPVETAQPVTPVAPVTETPPVVPTPEPTTEPTVETTPQVAPERKLDVVKFTNANTPIAEPNHE